MNKELPDFDTLLEMAKSDPVGLEKLRQEHVAAVIDSAEPESQRRLKGLQFQIDAQRKIHPSPMAACIKLSEMMFDSFTHMRYLLNEMSSIGEGEPAQNNRLEPGLAQVLKFQSPCTAVD